ncbi:MAG: CRISPR-associated helicase Cas3' [Planctomycetaceae bacterium]|nr:CRISPR-associated helicase Cas3' [Planctomycetaceae bacterium]
MSLKHYAHTIAGCLPESWEPLDVHLREVERRAGEMAQEMSARQWGELVGRWHDLGKYSAEFQDYLRAENGLEAHLEQHSRVDHSTAGAQHADSVVKPWGKLLAYVIAGHHAGLTDAAGSPSSLEGRLAKNIAPFDEAPTEIRDVGDPLTIPPLAINQADEARASFQVALFTRMLFSCLVDADFLATEAFMDIARSAERPETKVLLPAIKQSLDDYLSKLSRSSEDTDVNQRRTEVLAACRESATSPPGFFSLTVPTGGGKTLASLAFALDHANLHVLKRVVYAIPFTSIIEQTAEQFRRVLGDLAEDVVLEHHSNLDPKRETRRSRLAAENWDAPLVVTTNVQLFESLFAARTSRCRKLHNLIGSVIILDEAQTLPVELLQPCLAVLRELVTDYRCTIVLCTATQPVLNRREGFAIGLENVQEIIPDPRQLDENMQRVRAHSLGAQTDSQLVERFEEQSSFLCIVNTRAHASSLYRMLQAQQAEADDLFHLSTLMCGEHRSRQIIEIRERLKDKRCCRVISTQLIEAGVDVDFPIVFRAMTGLDSIAQAAGRCNREGRLKSGDVFVFEPTDVKLHGYLSQVTSTAREVLPDFDDLLDPAAIQRYFELHYWKQGGEHQWDKPDVMGCFPKPLQKFAFDFRTAAERFRMIEDASHSIFVPYDEMATKLIDELDQAGSSRGLLRQLQRYSVNVFEYMFNELLRAGDVQVSTEHGYALLTNPDAYDEQLGLRIDRPGFMEAETLIA